MILLKFTKFYLQYGGSDCRYDNVTVFDGESVTPVATLCGWYNIPSPITSSESSMIVRFTTDWRWTHIGFSVQYVTLAAAGSGSASFDTGPTSSDPGKCSHQLKLYMFG